MMTSRIDNEENASFSFVLSDRLTILAVDDDPIQREFCSVYLSTPTAEVVTVESAEAGLALMDRQNSTWP